MAIVASSTIIEDRLQVDGRRHVTERHTTDAGRALDVSYMAEKRQDANATMAGRVVLLDQCLADEDDRIKKDALRESTLGKLDVYIAGLTDLALTLAVELTDEERSLLKAGSVRIG